MTLTSIEEAVTSTPHNHAARPHHDVPHRGSDLVGAARLLAREVAGPFADDVDARARFPAEAIAGLRRAKLLGASVPVELGGMGAGLSTLGAMCEALAEQCSATAMIYAMHLIQVECIRRHAGGSAFFAGFLSEIAQGQRLIASVTSEAGVGGDLRRSIAAVERSGERILVKKNATTISYGRHADDLLVTVRAAPDATPGDQVLVLLRGGDYSLEGTSTWDTIGMRGTCSNGFLVSGEGGGEQILPEAFADIATQTMTPVSHCLWSSVWLGIAAGAETRARTFVQQQARSTPGTVPPSAQRLAELSAVSQTLRTLVGDYANHCDALFHGPTGLEELSSLAFALRTNNLKVTSSQLAVDITRRALEICGIAAYKNDSPFALGRHLRDALSAPLMIANDRIRATNASLLLVLKDDAKADASRAGTGP